MIDNHPDLKVMSKHHIWLPSASAASLLVLSVSCGPAPADQSAGQAKREQASVQAGTTPWARVPLGDGRLQTRNIDDATMTLPGSPAPSVFDVQISPSQTVSFDGLRYGALVFLCMSHSVKRDRVGLRQYEDSVYNALVERFRKLYQNLLSARESGIDTSVLQISSGDKHLAEFTAVSDGRRLVVVGVVSVSPGVGWNDALVQQFFGSVTLTHVSPVLSLLRTTDNLLVFTDPPHGRFFIVPRVQFDSALPPLLDFRSDDDSVRFSASLVWPDALGGPRDALSNDLEKGGRTQSLFRHNLTQVTVSLEIDGVIVNVWHDPGLKEDFELTFKAGQPQYGALQKLTTSATVRDSARLKMRADLVAENARIEYIQKAFPPEVTLKIDRR